MTAQTCSVPILIATVILGAILNSTGCALAEYWIADGEQRDCSADYGEHSSECSSSEAELQRLEDDSDENLEEIGESLEDLEDELNE